MLPLPHGMTEDRWVEFIAKYVERSPFTQQDVDDLIPAVSWTLGMTQAMEEKLREEGHEAWLEGLKVGTQNLRDAKLLSPKTEAWLAEKRERARVVEG